MVFGCLVSLGVQESNINDGMRYFSEQNLEETTLDKIMDRPVDFGARIEEG